MGNILWLASYPKSGNTWLRVFIENYLANSAKAVDINTIHQRSIDEVKSFRYQPYVGGGRNTMELDNEEICAIRPMVHADIAAQAQGTVFVKSHNFQGEYKGYPLHNWQVSSGAIYVIRNPLDVAVSMANYFDQSIDDTIAFMAEELTGTPNEAENVPQIITSWSMHVKSWTENENEHNKLVLRYEDMLDNPRKAFRKVESLLGMKRNPSRLMRAIKHASFKQMQAQESGKGFVEKHENAGRFFRQGKQGQWQNVLTDSQVQKIIDSHHEQMARFKYLP